MSDDPRPPGGGPRRWTLKPATDHGLPLGDRLRSLSRERGLLDTLIGTLWWSAVAVYLRGYHRRRIVGAEHLPDAAPFILVANHSSHLDAMALTSALPRRLRHGAYPIAAGDAFFESPTRATFAAFVLNALPMWRRSAGRYALTQLRQRLVEEPCGFVLFPEGTRSRTGDMASFKPGLGMLVAGTSVPVIPCFLSGAYRALPPGATVPRPRRLHLAIGPPLLFADTANNKAGWLHIAAATESAVRALQPPVDGP